MISGVGLSLSFTGTILELDMVSLRLVRLPRDIAETVASGIPEARAVLAKEENESGQWFFLGNGWAALHFVLSGQYPLTKDEVISAGLRFHHDQRENVLMGGTVTKLPSEHGAVRYMDPEEVRRNWRLLSTVDAEKFRERYSAEALDSEDIPPYGWSDEPEREDALVDAYCEVLDFYKDAVADGHGIILEFVD